MWRLARNRWTESDARLNRNAAIFFLVSFRALHWWFFAKSRNSSTSTHASPFACPQPIPNPITHVSPRHTQHIAPLKNQCSPPSTKVTEHHHSFSRSCTSHPSLISLSYSRNPSLQREESPCVIAWPLPSFLLSRPRLCLSTLSGRRRRLAL